MKTIGSRWGKWDFHVHTPYSILNNQFGFDPFDAEDNYHEKEFDQYVITLFTKAIENEIVAIGITDYFMIEGYKRIKEKYLDCPKKLEECFPDASIRDKVKNIHIFPNIEFRIDKFIGKNANSVNYHVIFSDDVSVTDIEENFLKAIKFESNPNDSRSVTVHNIEKFGQDIINNNGERGSNLLVGLKHITVKDSDIIEILAKPLFEKNILLLFQ